MADLRGPTEQEKLQWLQEMARQAKYGGARDITPEMTGLGLGAKVLGPMNSLLMGLMGQETGVQPDPNTQPLDLGLLDQAVVPGPTKLLRKKLMGLLSTPREKVQLVPPDLVKKPLYRSDSNATGYYKDLLGILEGVNRASLSIRGRGPLLDEKNYPGLRTYAKMQEAEHLDTDVMRGVAERFEDIGKTGPGNIGPKFVREVLENLAAQYPAAKSLGGTRVTGMTAKAQEARLAKGGPKWVKADYDLNRVRPETEMELLKVLQNPRQWLNMRISSGIPVTSAEKEREMIRTFLNLPPSR